MSRERVFSMRLTDDEQAHLEQLADIHGEDKSAMIRRLIGNAPLVSVRMTEPPRYMDERCTCCPIHGGNP